MQQKHDPFLVWYAPFLPHLPHDAPERFRKLYESAPSVPRHTIPYYATCTWFDATVGQLVEHIEKSGLAENTIFVFAVDNGFAPDPQKPMAHGDFNYTKTSKRSPFDDGLRTPILIRWDGHTEVAEHPNPCSSVDIVPTVLDALGIGIAGRKFPGRSLWPSATGAKPLRAKPLRAEPVLGAIYPGDASSLGHPERDVAYRWIRSGRFKLIVPHAESGGKPWGGYLDQPALFDVITDPEEQTDLAQHPTQADTLRRLEAATRSMVDTHRLRVTSMNQSVTSQKEPG